MRRAPLRYPVFLPLAAGLCLAHPAAAQEAACERSTFDRSHCEIAAMQAERAALDARFARLRQHPGLALLQDRLDSAQDGWRAFAGHQCELEADLVFGTGGSLALPVCHRRMIAERQRFLDAVADEAESRAGDLSAAATPP